MSCDMRKSAEPQPQPDEKAAATGPAADAALQPPERTGEAEKRPVDECGKAPGGMKCIPVGPFIMGEDGLEKGFPAHEVFVDTFFIDSHEITNEDYKKCVKAGACVKKMKYRGYIAARQPMVPATWYDADAYCRWAGKRLPTEAEWEKAARGTKGQTYPWGDASPGCDKAAYRECDLSATLSVGSFPPNAYGLYDMAGNSYEWVRDWYAPCLSGCDRECGEGCGGSNPKGPCGGKAPCKNFKLKVLKGGSWYWGPKTLKAAHRRPMPPDSGEHRLGFRCAMDAKGKNFPAQLQPLKEKEKRIFFTSEEDTLPEARVDEKHYVHSNEGAHRLFFPYIKNSGGGYIGVGADQNYTLVAKSRPELAWIIDYDGIVVLVHHVHRAFILESETPEEFLALWDKEKEEEALAIIQKHEGDNPSLDKIEKVFKKYSGNLSAYFGKMITLKKHGAPVTWLSDPEAYATIRRMYAADRLRLMVGNLMGDKALKGIGKAAKELGITIRIVYLTNAEEFIAYDGNFVNGFKSLPFDGESIILRTASSNQGYEKADYKWHYNIQGIEDFIKRIGAGVRRVQTMLRHGQSTPITGLTNIWI